MSRNQDPFLIIKNYRQEIYQLYVPILKRRKQTVNSWTDKQHLQYLKFFQENLNLVSTQHSRKTNKIFVQMAKYIPTRSPVQIKSHHQKLMGKFNSITTILFELSQFLNVPLPSQLNAKFITNSHSFTKMQGLDFRDSNEGASFSNENIEQDICQNNQVTHKFNFFGKTSQSLFDVLVDSSNMDQIFYQEQ